MKDQIDSSDSGGANYSDDEGDQTYLKSGLMGDQHDELGTLLLNLPI